MRINCAENIPVRNRRIHCAWTCANPTSDWCIVVYLLPHRRTSHPNLNVKIYLHLNLLIFLYCVFYIVGSRSVPFFCGDHCVCVLCVRCVVSVQYKSIWYTARVVACILFFSPISILCIYIYSVRRLVVLPGARTSTPHMYICRRWSIYQCEYNFGKSESNIVTTNKSNKRSNNIQKNENKVYVVCFVCVWIALYIFISVITILFSFPLLFHLNLCIECLK